MCKLLVLMKGGLYYIHDLLELDTFDMNQYHALHTMFIFNNRQRMDYTWIEQQIDYLNQLSNRKRHIVRAYTIYGDKFINNFLRGLLTPHIINITLAKVERDNENPFMYQHQDATGKIEIDEEYKKNIITYIHYFIEEFKEIINLSPKLIKRITVFRGINDDQFLIDAMKHNNTGNKYINYTEFLSTSFYLSSSLQFIENSCCILELHLEQSVPCLLTGHFSRRRSEFEITFIPDTKMININPTWKIPIENYETNDILVHPEKYDTTTIRIYEATILY